MLPEAGDVIAYIFPLSCGCRMKGTKLSLFSLFFLAGLFILLPSIRLESTQDPGLAMRFLVCSAGMMIFYAYSIFRMPDVEVGSSSGKFVFILIATIAWMLISTLSSINTFDALWEISRLSVLYLFFFTSFILFSGKKGIAGIAGRFCIPALIIFSAYAFVQLLPAISDFFQSGKPFRIDLGIGSSLGNKNFFAEVLVMIFPLLFRNFFDSTGKWRVFYVIALFLCFGWIIILQYVAAWLALITAFVFSLLVPGLSFISFSKVGVKRSKNRPWAMLVIALVILLSVLSVAGRYGSFENFRGKINVAKQYLNNPGIIDSTSTFNDNSVFERILLWRNSLRMISDHPLTGVGMNNWKLLQPQYGIGGTPFINTGMVHFEHPHNDFLLILCEQGPVGLILYIAFFVFLIVKSLQFRCGTEDVRHKSLLSWLCFSLVAFAVLSFFGFPRSRFYAMLLLMFYAAIILLNDPERRTRVSNKNHGYRLFLIVSLCISILGVFASWSRYQGELHTREMLKAQFAKNFARMEREADKAASWFYKMDHTATPLAWYKGMAHFYSGNIDAAIPLYEEALAINPNHLRIINDLATCYERKGDYTRAIEKYKDGLKIAPFFTEGLLNLSATYYNLGLKDSALSAINKVQLLKISHREKVNYELYLNTILEAMAVEYVDSNFTGLKAEELKGRIRNREFGLPELYKNSSRSGDSFSNALDSLLRIKRNEN